LFGSIARGGVEAAGAVVVAIAVVLLGRNQETRAYAMKNETFAEAGEVNGRKTALQAPCRAQ
jgi:hypothetical protein